MVSLPHLITLLRGLSCLRNERSAYVGTMDAANALLVACGHPVIQVVCENPVEPPERWEESEALTERIMLLEKQARAR